ncbi:MAG TPA: DUF58 domain-containing protein [Nitrolancea sp.]|nr:DUF58 domain-containing protein [Nitrolancea sp.]
MALLPSRRLLALALAAGVPLALASVFPVLLFVALLCFIGLVALVVFDVRGAPKQQQISVERLHDQRLSLGEPNRVTLRVRLKSSANMARRNYRIWLRDEPPPEIPGATPQLAGSICPSAEWEGGYDLRPLRRGTYQFGDVWLRIETPLRLALRQYGFPLSEPVRVYPNLRAVRQYDLLIRRGRLAEVGVHRTRYLGRGNEFERLRDYQPDDEYRRINWKATARRNLPVTVEYETERSQSLLLLLDTGRLMGSPIGDLDKLDHALNSALLLAYVATKMGDRVGTLAFADQVRAFVPPARGDQQFQLILDALHAIRAQPVESDLRRTAIFLASHQTRRSLILLFTDLAAEIEGDERVASLSLLSRRHLVVFASLTDPDLVALAGNLPDDSRQAYEKVVAWRLLEERRRQLERLNRLGIATLQGSPEELTPAVINHYLETKARSRL